MIVEADTINYFFAQNYVTSGSLLDNL